MRKVKLSFEDKINIYYERKEGKSIMIKYQYNSFDFCKMQFTKVINIVIL